MTITSILSRYGELINKSKINNNNLSQDTKFIVTDSGDNDIDIILREWYQDLYTYDNKLISNLFKSK